MTMSLKRKADDESTNHTSVKKKKKNSKFSAPSENDVKTITQKIVVAKDVKITHENKPVVAGVILPPTKPQDISSNWKQLIKSGKVKYTKSKKTEDKGLSGNNKREEVVEKTLSNVTNNKISELPDVWFDDVDEILLEPPRPVAVETNESGVKRNPLVKPYSPEGLTKVVAMDCEMVGVGYGAKDSILARCSIVNQYGQCVFDRYCRPTEKVTDYRTEFSGIRPENIAHGADFKVVQKQVSEIIDGRILVGHDIRHDLKVLFLDHPKKMIRDTSKYKPFRKLSKGGTPSLKKLSALVLGVEVQKGEHDSIQDAQAAMRLYTLHRKNWEAEIVRTGGWRARKKAPPSKKKKSPKISEADP